jgi:antitoxin (DNA-binding transcriptional repressor) of toxin-antitoxin stability system
MATTGLRERWQYASELVRHAEAGETVIITVSGGAVAELGPVSTHRWRRWDEIAEIFAGPSDKDWAADRERIDQALVDPWPKA